MSKDSKDNKTSVMFEEHLLPFMEIKHMFRSYLSAQVVFIEFKLSYNSSVAWATCRCRVKEDEKAVEYEVEHW